MPVEVEARFRAESVAALEPVASSGTLGSASLGPPTTFDEVDRYLDTDRGDLAAARWACRLRTRRGTTVVSLKGPQGEGSAEDGWLHRRPEREGPATDSTDPRDWPPSDARDLVDELSGRRPLHERLRLLQRRTEREVALPAAPRLGTLSLDEVVVVQGERELGTVAMVELELASVETEESERQLRELASALASVRGLSPEPRTKLELALALLPPE